MLTKEDIPQDVFGPALDAGIDLDRGLTIRFRDIDGLHEIRTCHGDIRKGVDALMDYAHLLELACDAWDLKGFHRASYELRAEQLRKIARKYQESIGYDYDAVLAACESRKPKKEEDVGEDGLTMMVRKAEKIKKQTRDVG